MATYAEVEDMRDWLVDSCAELLAKIDTLNGEEPPLIVAEAQQNVEHMHQFGLKVIAALDDLLVQKKRYTP